MLDTAGNRDRKGLLMRLALAALLLGAACTLELDIIGPEAELPETPAATSTPEAIVPTIEIPEPELPTLREEVTPPATTRALADGPTFTPFTQAPSIVNRQEVINAMEANYPPLLRDAGIGGTVRVYFFVSAEGTVEDVRIDQSAGHPALDAAAQEVARVYRFSPALNKDEKVPVWVSFPITFQVR